MPEPAPHPPQTTDGLLHTELTGALRAILYEVHRELGPGFMHMHYRRAVQIELRRCDLACDTKKEVQIAYRGQPIETRETRLLVVADAVMLAPVAVRSITPKHKQRFRQYLELFNLELGLIANFHSTSLEIETIRIRPRKRTSPG